MKKRLFIILSLIPALLFYAGYSPTGSGTGEVVQGPDSLRAIGILSKARALADNWSYDSARILFLEARQVSVDNHLPYIEALSCEGLASLYDSIGIWEYTLRYMLMAATKYRNSYDSLPAASLYNRLAARYSSLMVPDLAAQYFHKEFMVYDRNNTDLKAEAALNTFRAFHLTRDTVSTLAWHDSARVWLGQSKSPGTEKKIYDLNTLAIPLLASSGNIAEAMSFARWNLDRQPVSDRKAMVLLNNNIGFLYFKAGDYRQSLDHFRKAEEYCLTAPVDEASLAGIYSNMAICYQSLGDNELMFKSFSKALRLAEKTRQISEKARIEMLLATIYNSRKDLYNSELYCLDCIASSRESGNLEILQICYGLYAEVLENGNDFIKALEYYQKHLTLRDSLQYYTGKEAEKYAERKAYYETIEQNLKLDIADEEKKDLELRSQKAELEKQDKELQLLYSVQERTHLEKESLLQSLALSKEKEETERRRQEIKSLEQVRLNQEMELEKKAMAERELQGQNELLASEARAKELELAREQEARKLTLLIALLMVLVAVIILYALLSVRKKNQKLAESKRQIEKINTDLEAKNAEISNQKEIIEQKNQSITDSIQYAARIQNAVLLPLTFLTDWGLENFIFFRPKDIVSGDFYWGFRKKGQIYIAAADCTGHGVPGGFMSMLGIAFLNEIAFTSDINSASLILDKLRTEIIRALRQRGATGETRDGMDISLVIIDQGKRTIQYAGANNPLYLVRNGNLTRYQADRMPIGIHVTEISPFTNHIINTEAGDTIYLFSDGYADQFGGPTGKKFMYKPFQQLLTSVASEPASKQSEVVVSTFEKWIDGHDQVDDILVIGVTIP